MDNQANDVAPNSEDPQREEASSGEHLEQAEEALDLKNEAKEAAPAEEKEFLQAGETEPKENGDTRQQEEEAIKNKEQELKDEKQDLKPEEKPVEHTRLEQKPRIIVKHSILGNRIPSQWVRNLNLIWKLITFELIHSSVLVTKTFW